MAYDLDNKLVIAISSRALFNLEDENNIFISSGFDEYYSYQLKNEDILLEKGTAFSLVENLLKINNDFPNNKQVEVIIMSKNNAATSLRITKSIEKYNLDIKRSAWTGGSDISKYLKAFKVDLFLSANDKDVRASNDLGIASARILPFTVTSKNKQNQVKIAFDGDAVLFSDESEIIFKNDGLEAFLEHEKINANKNLPDGPFAKLLRLISKIQKKYNNGHTPIRTALITARNSPAHERVIRTLNAWNVRIDESFFLGGMEKYEIIEAFEADIYFDDQDIHLENTSKKIASAKVPYHSDSEINSLK